MTSPTELDHIAARAAEAAPTLAAARPAERAAWLEAAAAALESARAHLVEVAMRETHLPQARLEGELTRTTFQLNLFAEVVREGSFLDARIDHADPAWGMGPRPDLRRVKVARGPVLVFAASNFPFAFSVAGGDAASALAAGCPVIVKAHEGHPELSRRVAAAVAGALEGAGAPAGSFALIEGREAGITLLKDPRIAAGGFTGSIAGGRALYDVAVSRPVPIPFFAEMGSVNPVVITPAAAAARGGQIAAGLVESMSMGVGQFCTKPGLVFVPAGAGLEELIAAIDLPAPGRQRTGSRTDPFRTGARGAATHPVVGR